MHDRPVVLFDGRPDRLGQVTQAVFCAGICGEAGEDCQEQAFIEAHGISFIPRAGFGRYILWGRENGLGSKRRTPHLRVEMWGRWNARRLRQLRRLQLEVSSSVAGYQAQEQGEENSSDNSYDDGIDEATGTGIAEFLHDEAADDGSDDADDDISDCAVTAALHELSCEEASDEAYDDPPNDEHLYFSLLFLNWARVECLTDKRNGVRSLLAAHSGVLGVRPVSFAVGCLSSILYA